MTAVEVLTGDVLPATADGWVDRLVERKRTQLVSAIDMGRDFITLKSQMPNQLEEIAARAGIGVRMVQMYVRVASHEGILDLVENETRFAPASIGALYELAQLEPPELVEARVAGRIRPDLTREGAHELVVDVVQRRPQPEPEPVAPALVERVAQVAAKQSVPSAEELEQRKQLENATKFGADIRVRDVAKRAHALARADGELPAAWRMFQTAKWLTAQERAEEHPHSVHRCAARMLTELAAGRVDAAEASVVVRREIEESRSSAAPPAADAPGPQPALVDPVLVDGPGEDRPSPEVVGPATTKRLAELDAEREAAEARAAEALAKAEGWRDPVDGVATERLAVEVVELADELLQGYLGVDTDEARAMVERIAGLVDQACRTDHVAVTSARVELERIRDEDNPLHQGSAGADPAEPAAGEAPAEPDMAPPVESIEEVVSDALTGVATQVSTEAPGAEILLGVDDVGEGPAPYRLPEPGPTRQVESYTDSPPDMDRFRAEQKRTDEVAVAAGVVDSVVGAAEELLEQLRGVPSGTFDRWCGSHSQRDVGNLHELLTGLYQELGKAVALTRPL